MGTTVFLVAAAVVLATLVGYLITIYNNLVTVKNNINKAWGNIDVLLKQRHDEIPKLLKICDGYMQYEKKTLTDIVEARSRAMGAKSVGDKSVQEGMLSAALGKLFALAENYPDLKAQQNFLHLQTRVADLENQIADRREFYNESVNNFNIRIQSFPDSIVANQMRLQNQEMFKASEAEKKDVEIKFNFPS